VPEINKEVRRPPRAIVEEFGHHSTPNISDACERSGIKTTCDGIIPMVQGVRIAGPAVTVRYVPLDPMAPVTKEDVGEHLFDVTKPGDVVVIDNGATTANSCWGDILTFTAMKLKLAGTVIDGVFRDYDTILEMRYPIFSRGRIPTTGKGRIQLDGINVPIRVGGIQVRPGDLIAGDDTGLLRVPFEKVEQVLTDTKEIEAAEESILDSVKAGLTLREAREKYGYFRLQKAK
jgi:4-hydroxy-4-methyl-2-oxoglutarate aldolase